MNIVLLTTTILSDESIKCLHRLFTSVKRNSNHGINIKHILLIQNPANLDIPEFASTTSHELFILVEDEKVSLSEARNKMLTFAQQNSLIANNDLVAFPDDDCWYPDNNLIKIFKQFEKHKKLDMFFCKYQSSDHDDFDESDIKLDAGAKSVVRNASSNTIFLRGVVVNSQLGFDRNLGVGSPNNGGEDLDYAIKSFLQARQTGFLNAYIIGHRDKNIELRGKYYRGSAIVLNRYKFSQLTLLKEFLRKVLIGINLLISRELSLKEFCLSMKFLKCDSAIQR